MMSGILIILASNVIMNSLLHAAIKWTKRHPNGLDEVFAFRDKNASLSLSASMMDVNVVSSGGRTSRCIINLRYGSMSGG